MNGEGDTPDVGLSFVDLLYAVPVADLAARVSRTHLHNVTASGWGDLGLALTAITFGWIGHHTNRQQLPPALRRLRAPATPFSGLRFWQFLVEIFIIGAYFVLGTRAVLPSGGGLGSPDEFGKGECLVAIFVLYLVWDLLDIRIARREGETKWAKRASAGMSVTLVFVVLFAAFLAVGWTERNHHLHSALAFDLIAIAFLYLYRRVQGYAFA